MKWALKQVYSPVLYDIISVIEYNSTALGLIFLTTVLVTLFTDSFQSSIQLCKARTSEVYSYKFMLFVAVNLITHS